MADPVYATPVDFWQMVAPPDTLFQDQSIEPGPWSGVTKTGVGTGSMTVSLSSNPRANFSVVVTCFSGGELNLYDILNSGPFPTFGISLDGGVHFTPPLSAGADGQLAYQKGGFTLVFSSGGSPPSFVANDTYTFTTTPSPDLLRALEMASREMDPYLRNTFCLPLTYWDQNVTLVCCELAFWFLIKRRGLDKAQDFKVYYPDHAYNWLSKAAVSDIQPGVKETGSGFIFSQFGQVRYPYRTDWRF